MPASSSQALALTLTARHLSKYDVRLIDGGSLIIGISCMYFDLLFFFYKADQLADWKRGGSQCVPLPWGRRPTGQSPSLAEAICTWGQRSRSLRHGRLWAQWSGNLELIALKTTYVGLSHMCESCVNRFWYTRRVNMIPWLKMLWPKPRYHFNMFVGVITLSGLGVSNWKFVREAFTRGSGTV